MNYDNIDEISLLIAYMATSLKLNKGISYSGITDYAKILGEESKFDGFYYERIIDNYDYLMMNLDGDYMIVATNEKSCMIQPIIYYKDIHDIVSKDVDNLSIIEYGEYPQDIAESNISKKLEKKYKKMSLRKTGKTYTINGAKASDSIFTSKKIEEYIYDNNKYVRIKNDSDKNSKWLKVSPIKWIVDLNSKMLISEKSLLSGIRLCNENGRLDNQFKNREVYKYLNKYFKKEIRPSYSLNNIKSDNKSNPYGFSYDDITEEDIIEGAISSGVTVFLHGKSSEGKTARVKELDPTCEVLSLCSATPERLNGKSVYVSDTGEMKDIPPSWLVRLNDKCKREPDRLHILFLDELTNALPSIQGMAYDIVLERRVNDLWDLPDNARVVCAGNEMEDSIAANQLAEPLFNRCAHVYIKTTTDKWLEWASNNNIHPAIISYIAYTGGEALRSKFDGHSPNADPRKWEMASKMLYKTNNPLMLRSLVGEDITREFTNFCSSHCITMEDVLNGNYTTDEIATLNTSERYITTASLTGVGEDKLDIIRSFVSKLGSEYLALFDSLWAHGDEARLERIADARLKR